MFSASVDSFKHSIICDDLQQAYFWLDEAYRTVSDSDTYYAYKAIDAYAKLLKYSVDASQSQEVLQSVADYFATRTDSFSLRMLAVAYSGLGTYWFIVDAEKSITYYDAARMYSAQVGDEVFAAYTVLLSSEAYEKDNHHIESAMLSRRILDNKVSEKYPILRFVAQLQLYKVYTQMRAPDMVKQYGDIIEREGFYLTDLYYEADFLFLKANHYLYIGKYEDALDCSLRLLQISELVGNAPKMWCLYLQSAKIYNYLGQYHEALRFIKICKDSPVYKHGVIFNSLYSSYHVDLFEALIYINMGNFEEAYAIIKKSNPPAKLKGMLEFGTGYYKCWESIYISRGDYHNAAHMLKKVNELHVRKYAQHAIQRSGDIDNLYQSDTTIISQDVMLVRKNSDLLSAKMKLILCGLIGLVIVVSMVLVRMLIIRYRRNESERIDIEQRERLEREVARQTKQLVQQKNEISNRNTDIVRSQAYARVIQEGVLPDISKFNYSEFRGSFIVYKIANVISSNLYWFRQFDKYIVVCCADCFEHGVPGSLIIMVGITILSDVTMHRSSFVASEIINDFNLSLIRMMPDVNQRNAMGVSVVIIDTVQRRFNVAALNSSFGMCIGGQMQYVMGSKTHFGYIDEDIEPVEYTDTFVDYSAGDSIYLYTDGVNSIVGGTAGEKLGQSRFREILNRSVGIPIEERGAHIEKWLNEWSRDAVQKVDYSIVGFELA